MIVAPSFLTADFTNLKTEIKSIARAKWLHFDVMDGIFVPSTTYDEKILSEAKKYSHQFFDCHLMIASPKQNLAKYIASGADLITFHYEAAQDEIFETIELIKQKNCQVGISIKPDTNPEVLLPYLNELDLILIMSVEPGKGGQKFISESLDKIRFFAGLRKIEDYSYLIEVDGGINLATAKLVKAAGADVIVAGSFIINNSDRAKIIEVLENV